MGTIVQVLFFTFAGILLLWFGYTLFFALSGGDEESFPFKNAKGGRPKPKGEGVPGAPRTCPVCSAKLDKNERVKSSAFPSLGGHERLMHISGCYYCLEGNRPRFCPVCGASLRADEFLIARMFEKPGRSHVHVTGCTRCKLRRI